MDARGGSPRVVIVGAGFAGLYAAKALARSELSVTLVDRRNHHLFQPLLYQVASAALNPADIAAPVRSVFRGRDNVTVVLGDVTRVDADGRRLVLADGEIRYDFLLLATGATHSYFGHDDWAAHAPGLKTVEDALEIRRRVLLAYERAEREPDEARRRAWLTFVLVGAGPTGVEMAGALAEIARHALSREFRSIDPGRARVVLVEAEPRVLPGYPPGLSTEARRQLERRGVEVRTSTKVTAIDAAGVSLGSERLEARTVVWAAGVTASPLAATLGAPLDRAGRVLVTPALTVPGHDEIFVAGDLVSLVQGDRPVPGVSPAAIQAGLHAARNIRRAAAGMALLPFRYRDKGVFATIGRGDAVGRLAGDLEVKGATGWILWLLVHVYYLIGFRNRIAVILQWAWAYVTFRRGARLITGGDPPAPPGA